MPVRQFRRSGKVTGDITSGAFSWRIVSPVRLNCAGGDVRIVAVSAINNPRQVQMSRAAFAITVPLIFAALVAVLGGYMIGLSFQGEGCRFARTSDMIWSAASDILLAQAVFGGLLALLVAALINIQTLRFKSLEAAPAAPRWIGIFAAIAFAAATVMLMIDQGLCSRSGALALIAAVSGGIAGLGTLAAAITAVVGFVRGLGGGPGKPPSA